MNATIISVGGRAPPRSRRLLQDRVRSTQLLVLLLKRLDALRVGRRGADRFAVVDRVLFHARPQRLDPTIELRRDTLNRSVRLTGLRPELAQHPHGPFLELR
jgi:hypothetical protein